MLVTCLPNFRIRRGVIAEKTRPILRQTLHIDLFFGHNFCVLTPNDSRFIG